MLERAIAELGLPPEWQVSVQVRPRRTTVGVEVDTNGTVLLAVPPTADPWDVVAILRPQMDRIARAVARRSAARGRHPAKELVNGEHFDVLGRTYRLLLSESSTPPVRLNGDRLELGVLPGRNPDAASLIEWYTVRGKEWAERTAPALALAAGVVLPTVRVRDLGTRWGLRERNGDISLHWALFQLPGHLAELALAHELTHLKVAGHTGEFNRELRKIIPNLVNHERRLITLGGRAWLGAVSRGNSSP